MNIIFDLLPLRPTSPNYTTWQRRETERKKRLQQRRKKLKELFKKGISLFKTT